MVKLIDCENVIFDTVATALYSAYPQMSIYSENIAVPSVFPCAVIEQADSSVYQKTQDSTRLENHAQLMYEVNVYSNLKSGKRSQAKSIMGLIDEQMSGMGFTRLMCNPVPNMDNHIYRLTARYSAVVAAGIVDGRNTIFQTYRR